METPRRIGKYELLQFLGGGMSHVYRATDTVLRRTVAVKILTEQGCSDREAKARFLQEAITAGNIQHENIIKVYDYGEENGRPFIVMEFLTGEDLRDAIRNEHTGDLRNRMRIALSVARAIRHVHEKRIIHRDIKPENIHIDQGGQVRLMDFGIAKSEGFSMTKTGFALGTPYYMSPEQVRGETATERVDVYAFGILLYELMSGAKPYTGDTLERLFYLILNEPVDIDALRRMNVPEPMCELIRRCTSKSAQDRPRDFVAVVAELERMATAAEAPPAQPNGAPAVASAPPSPPLVSAMHTPPPLEALAADAPAQLTATATPGPAPVPVAPPTPSKLAPMLAVAAVVLVCGIAGIYLLVIRPHIDGGGGDKKDTTVAQQDTKDTKKKALPPVMHTTTGDMVLVPEGIFIYGDDSTKNRAQVSLPSYYIDRTEVTNEAWAAYAAATGAPAPALERGSGPAEPVRNITIAQARDFARWAGKRLPTAQEWEKAARGMDGRKYPWGNEVEPARANVKTGRAGTANSNAEWPSPFGALNMAGNVWEFVEGPITPSVAAVDSWRQQGRLRPAPTVNEPWCAVRGGSFQFELEYAALYEWLPVPERAKGNDIGFRCAKDAPAGQ